MLAAAAAALVLALTGGALLLDSGGPSEQPAFAAATMRTSAGDIVGRVIVDTGDPASLFLTLPGWAEQVERYGVSGAAYAVRIEMAGRPATTRLITPTDGASWAATLDLDRVSPCGPWRWSTATGTWCEVELATS